MDSLISTFHIDVKLIIAQVINFAIIKPLEYSVVYQVNAEFEDIINYEQNLMNN